MRRVSDRAASLLWSQDHRCSGRGDNQAAAPSKSLRHATFSFTLRAPRAAVETHSVLFTKEPRDHYYNFSVVSEPLRSEKKRLVILRHS
jgi:hypothetical protein